MMAPEDVISEARARLSSERAAALDEIALLSARLAEKGNYGLGEGDPMIYHWELNLALRERAEQHLAEINQALEQLEMGIYGRCDRCGKPIEPERLAVLSHTTVCSQCAQRRR